MRKLGEGREAEIFAWDEGLVVRLMRDPADVGKLDREGRWDAFLTAGATHFAADAHGRHVTQP